jgi:uncharacterized protein YqeY
MTLLDRIDADRTAARRDGKTPVATFLGYLISEARKIGKDAKPPRESTDAEVITVIRKLIAQNEETIAITGGSVGPAVWQNKLLNGYLPDQLSEAELESLIRAFCTGQNWTDEKPSMKWMGSVMTMLKECQAGKYNPQLASQITKKILAELSE